MLVSHLEKYLWLQKRIDFDALPVFDVNNSRAQHFLRISSQDYLVKLTIAVLIFCF